MLSFSLKHWKKLRAWWSTPLGQSFIKAESAQIKKVTPTLFGYHLLLLGEPQLMQCMKESPITHRVWIHPQIEITEDSSALTARLDKLPILTDSVDIVYLAHCLEVINNPHEVLRETFRVLISGGHVIISCFNPWSIWGLYRWIMRYIRQPDWDGRFISVARLKDWLALLGFDVISSKGYFFRPPITHIGTMKRLKWLELLGQWCWPFLGAGYVLVAKKRIITLTPIKPAWQDRRKLAHANVVEPVSRTKIEY
jgi:SAM-dependent methyltransferase